jgi:predicted dehydrogenase
MMDGTCEVGNVMHDIGKVVLIGAGQIGSRHLQAIAKIAVPVIIEVVDPNQESLQVARERFKQIPANPNVRDISFFNTINDIRSEVDVCIVATSSDIRARVIKELLLRKRVRYLILEKILFQSENEFSTIGRLIEKKKVKTWVNCTRRIMPFYVELKQFFSQSDRVYFEVHGGEWGLASNAIHFIDYLAFLTNCSEYLLDGSGLDEGFADCKREGFIEVSGTLLGYFSNCSTIVLHSQRGSSAPVIINISNGNCQAIIREGSGSALIARKINHWEWDTVEFSIPYQSEITHILVMNILRQDQCELTTFEESARLHKPFLKAIRQHIKKVTGDKVARCRVT